MNMYTHIRSRNPTAAVHASGSRSSCLSTYPCKCVCAPACSDYDVFSFLFLPPFPLPLPLCVSLPFPSDMHYKDDGARLLFQDIRHISMYILCAVFRGHAATGVRGQSKGDVCGL